MRRTLTAWLTLAVLFSTAPAEATIVLQLSDATLARDADAIVHGRVVSKSAAWHTTTRRIYTTYQIEALQFVKSPTISTQRPRTLAVRVLGGTVGHYGMRVAGTTRMSVGDEVVLFLERVRGEWMVLGMSQGKFEVYRDAKTNTRWVRARRTGLTLATRDKSGRLMYTHAKPRPDRRFDAFLQQIRNHLKAKR
ncbi:MAG: hypothetical protein KC609_08235 [Myxococcales bacterium]|nr:hypothetical protein [Myxococcales bacterium]